VFALVGVAYLTVLERSKVLTYIQFHKRPKVGSLGLLQPFGDGLKLSSKEGGLILKADYYIYYICPVMLIVFMLQSLVS